MTRTMDNVCLARRYLSEAYRLDQRITNDLRQLEELKALATHVTSHHSDMKVQESHDRSRMEDTVIKIIGQERAIDDEIDALVDLKKEIRGVIRAVPSPEEEFVLEERYLCFRSWEDVAADMGYGMDNVFRLHRRALQHVRVPEARAKALRRMYENS